MILATFARNGAAPAIGLVDRAAATILDLQALYRANAAADHPSLVSMQSLIESGEGGLDLVRALGRAAEPRFVYRLDSVRLLAPVPVPLQIREFSVFEQHVRDAPIASSKLKNKLYGTPLPANMSPTRAPKVFYDAPAFYQMNRFSMAGPDDEVEWPSYSRSHFDYELEIAMFIGRGGKNIPRERAHEHIFGYTIFNDFSAREQQWREMETRMGPSKGKSFDTGNTSGPWIVTRDEMPDIAKLDVSVIVNGETWTRTTTGGMLHSFEDMIAYVSKHETLHPGEMFASGTVGGCSGMEIDRWIKVGDVVELDVSGIGRLRNRVTGGPAAA